MREKRIAKLLGGNSGRADKVAEDDLEVAFRLLGSD
jgi:hypothetical protein